MATTFKDINDFTLKPSVTGSEEVQVSATEKVALDQIANLAKNSAITLTGQNYFKQIIGQSQASLDALLSNIAFAAGQRKTGDAGRFRIVCQNASTPSGGNAWGVVWFDPGNVNKSHALMVIPQGVSIHNYARIEMRSKTGDFWPGAQSDSAFISEIFGGTWSVDWRIDDSDPNNTSNVIFKPAAVLDSTSKTYAFAYAVKAPDIDLPSYAFIVSNSGNNVINTPSMLVAHLKSDVTTAGGATFSYIKSLSTDAEMVFALMALVQDSERYNYTQLIGEDEIKYNGTSATEYAHIPSGKSIQEIIAQLCFMVGDRTNAVGNPKFRIFSSNFGTIGFAVYSSSINQSAAYIISHDTDTGIIARWREGDGLTGASTNDTEFMNEISSSPWQDGWTILPGASADTNSMVISSFADLKTFAQSTTALVGYLLTDNVTITEDIELRNKTLIGNRYLEDFDSNPNLVVNGSGAISFISCTVQSCYLQLSYTNAINVKNTTFQQCQFGYAADKPLDTELVETSAVFDNCVIKGSGQFAEFATSGYCERLAFRDSHMTLEQSAGAPFIVISSSTFGNLTIDGCKIDISAGQPLLQVTETALGSATINNSFIYELGAGNSNMGLIMADLAANVSLTNSMVRIDGSIERLQIKTLSNNTLNLSQSPGGYSFTIRGAMCWGNAVLAGSVTVDVTNAKFGQGTWNSFNGAVA